MTVRDTRPVYPPEYDYEIPEMYKTTSGIVKRGRKCTECGRRLPKGSTWHRTVTVLEGKLTYTQSCKPDWQDMPCPLRFEPCTADGCVDGLIYDNLGATVYENGYPKICLVCKGKGFLEKDPFIHNVPTTPEEEQLAPGELLEKIFGPETRPD